MTKRQWVILGALFLFLVIVVVFGISQKKEFGEPVKKTEEIKEVAATGTQRVEFVPEIPKDITTTTKPVEKYDAPGGSGNIFGVYEVSISKNGFSQTDLAVTKGDFVRVRVSSADGEYDFSIPQYGTYVLVQKGETKEVTFIPDTTGTFLFECRDKCPDGKKISGRFVVLPK